MTSTEKKTAINQGVIIFVFLAILTALEFFIAIGMDAILLLVVIALIKAGLVAYYYMHIYKLKAQGDGDRNSYKYKTGSNRMGLWMFILSDAFVFTGLFISRFNLMGLTRLNLNQTLGLGVTSVLLLSSFFMNRAETSMAHGDRQSFLRGTLITILLGVGFLVGVIGVEWRLAAEEGLTATTSAATGIFYMMTGMHAFHVLTGVLFLLVVFNNGRRGLYSKEKHWAVEASAVYWHFIDVVWIFFYPALYLIGSAIG